MRCNSQSLLQLKWWLQVFIVWGYKKQVPSWFRAISAINLIFILGKLHYHLLRYCRTIINFKLGLKSWAEMTVSPSKFNIKLSWVFLLLILTKFHFLKIFKKKKILSHLVRDLVKRIFQKTKYSVKVYNKKTYDSFMSNLTDP